MTTAVNTNYTAGDIRSLSDAINDLGVIANTVLTTGWRNISSLIDSTWSVTQAVIRRDGDRVTLRLTGVASLSGSGFASMFTGGSGAVPVGFRPKSDTDLSRVVRVSSAQAMRGVQVGSAGAFNAERLAYPTCLEFTWTCWGDFPTSLPGTAHTD